MSGQGGVAAASAQGRPRLGAADTTPAVLGVRSLLRKAAWHDNVHTQAVVIWQRNHFPYEITQRDSSAR